MLQYRSLAVGDIKCTPFLCDTDLDGSAMASDALRVLKKAMRQVINLACSRRGRGTLRETKNGAASSGDRAVYSANGN